MSIILDDVKLMKEFDHLKILDAIVKFPEQCERGIKIGEDFVKKAKIKKPKGLCVCGMGASGIIGNLLRNIIPDKQMIVIKDYDIPEFVDSSWLVVLVSYSGGTEEPVNCFRQALERKLNVLGVCSGGELASLMKKRRKPMIKVPSGLPPRYGTGYMLFPLLVLLKKIGFSELKTNILKSVVMNLQETRDEIKPDVPMKNNISKRIAFKIKNTIPMVMSFGDYESVCYRAKTQFNENSKIPASVEILPEMNHNSILAFEYPHHLTKRFSVLLIRDESEGVQIRKRVEFTKGLLRKSCDSLTELWSLYPSPLGRMLSIMYILDFVSVYLAFVYENDPGDYSLLLELKKILKQKV
ncbi:MAG: bifunctional phosphoglucose/phosphomannose isomerase [Candidatus Aenigmarchaeota archaeon]|nr:bifunctional phosphoglucose/phosphomannose isomerase [Candidatus Aenigmarchaeota archaeon]